MSTQWNSFFMIVGGTAAALAGLIFVVISINYQIIFQNATQKIRTVNMLTGFTGIFMASGLELIGNQCLNILGFEWLFLWLIATIIFIRRYVTALRSGMNFVGLKMPHIAGVTMCFFAEILGAIFLILGYSSGLFIAAATFLVLFAYLISSAWLLLVDTYENLAD